MRGKFTLKGDYVYKMPVHFGGHPFIPVRTVYRDMTCIGISFETDLDQLAEYIPDAFEIIEPRVIVQYANARDVDWMSGGEYRLIQASAPVRYLGNEEGLTGEYVLVIWENRACPIIGGREEDGMPKIYADIAVEKHVGDHWFTSASYECNTFLQMDFWNQGEADEATVVRARENPNVNNFAWRYLPNLGRGGATLSHATLYPQQMFPKRVWHGEGKLNWTQLTQEQHLLQCGIILAMSRLPVVKYLEATMVKATAQLNVGDSRILP